MWDDDDDSVVDHRRYSPALESAAKRRLLRDYKEIVNNPLTTVVAAPLDNDIFEWHCNIRPDSGPYAGVPLHLIVSGSCFFSLTVSFSSRKTIQPLHQDFRSQSSSLTLSMTLLSFLSIDLGSVFSRNFVCLDLIQEYKSAAYTGWTSAYTVMSILLQLQSPLLPFIPTHLAQVSCLLKMSLRTTTVGEST